MLTVWTLNWGEKYDDYYVQRLQREVNEYLTLPHDFKCITDRKIEGVDCIKPPTDWPGWWGKIGLWKPGFCADFNLWLDLDVVIVDNLDSMVIEYADSHLACAKNWAASGHGGCQSSVMLWKGGKGCQAESIYRDFVKQKDRPHWPPINKPGVLWGDQEKITQLRDAGRINVTHFEPELVVSYKYHVRPTHSVPAGAKIVCFHGPPKPSECQNENWFTW